jgi:hypothetical protein
LAIISLAFLQCGENFRGVSLGRDFVPNFANLSVGADPEGHPHDSEKSLPEEAFHPPRAEGFDHFESRIRKQRKIQFVLHFEFGLRVHGITAAAQDCRIQRFKFLDGVTKLGRFRCSTGCVGLRIEIKNQVLPGEIRQGNRLAIVGDHIEFRSLITFLQHRFSV